MFRDFTVLAGPCALEDETLNLEVAWRLKELSTSLSVPIIFKGSFDKANRSKLESPRGLGLKAGLQALARVREETELPVLTDIHEPEQAGPAGEVVDVIQIPAFLCRQTDLLVAAGRTGRTVNIKKGQWMAPEDMVWAVEKARTGGAHEIVLTERGTFHGYGDLVVDMRSIPRMQATSGVPVIFDGTHSIQRPGTSSGSSGGDPELIPTLVNAAVAAGCDGLFLEVHPDPQSAPSDSTNMLSLDRLQAVLERALRVRRALQSEDRKEIADG